MPRIETIAAMRLMTDGDWHFSEELREMYFEKMVYDGGYEKQVKIFDDAAEAASFLANLALCASRGLSRSRGKDPDDRCYPDSLSTLHDEICSPVFIDVLKKIQTELATSEGQSSSQRHGGILFSYETGNWSWDAALMLRVDGIVGELEYEWIEPPK